MLKLNENSTSNYEIGKSTNSNQLVYASINKFAIEYDQNVTRNIKLAQIKCKYYLEIKISIL